MNETVLIEVNLDGEYFGSGLEKKMREAYHEVDKAISDQNNRGYKVVSVTPLTAGKYSDSENESYGYSYTQGILIVFEAMEEDE